MGRRVIATILILVMLGGLAFFAFTDFNAEKSDSTITRTPSKKVTVDDDTIVIWYTDDTLTQYISDAALIYRQEYGIDVRMEKVSGVDYIENVNSVSIDDNPEIPAPDLYITTHDNLMKAYLAGLAVEINDGGLVVIEDRFPGTALRAVTCDDKYVAYPLYFETNFFLYNKTYMASIAQSKIKTEADKAEGEAAEEEVEADASAGGEPVAADDYEDPLGDEDAVADQEVLDRLSTMIPARISDITTFANNYDAPEAVEAVFKWDISDIFYNYFFVGNYMEVGGEAGDNNAIFNLYNQQAVECLKKYQDMNQYFTMEDTDNYDSILQQFIDGKLVFTIATTDAFARIEEAQMNGEFDFDYGVAIIPDVSDILFSRGLSVTDVIAVNGYSKKKEAANGFAALLSYDQADTLYTKAGKLACKREVPYENSEITNVMTEYQKSMPLPKMIETSNFWLQLEIAFSKVWAGEDPDTVLKELADTMEGQIEEITYSIPVQESISAGVQTFFTK